MLITPNEYKILQQTALDTSYLILNSFSTLSGKTTEVSSLKNTIDSDRLESLEQIKAARAKKREQTKFVELFNSDPKSAMDKIVEEGFILKDEK